VADNCDISTLVFEDLRVTILRPEIKLANNIKSHFYAIKNFKRNHERITIIDSDNLVDPNYFVELNKLFDSGFEAVQGVRKAKNLNSDLACLDEAGDIYYRYIDRFLLFNVGSSASLAGSGMAFSAKLYVEALNGQQISGAGFDKLLQYQLVDSETRIAFARNAVVYDTKTSKSKQLVEQRARWINTWFKYVLWGLKMMLSSISDLSWNKFVFSIMLLRPPLFLLFSLAFVVAVIDVIYYPHLLLGLVVAAILFLWIFFKSLFLFSADRRIFQSLKTIPKFVLLQLLALINAKRANKLSVATKHDHSNPV
jgi:cellulose synthase/poly-beta-1,6-N-acetylglucosamine synthase-like glycosyltransferase